MGGKKAFCFKKGFLGKELDLAEFEKLSFSDATMQQKMGSFCDHYSHRSNSRGGNKRVGASKIVIIINMDLGINEDRMQKL